LRRLAFLARWRELGWVVGSVGDSSSAALARFRRQKTIALTTYRRDGTAVATPVSIAVDDDRVYVRSFEKAWKTRRIRTNPAVLVAPSTMRGAPTGPAVTATARRLSGADNERASRALMRKYPLLHGLLVPLMHRLGRAKTGRTVHFELTPSAAAPSRDIASATSGHH
jgi:PPOX class probable F420-dependent enzyme